MDKRFLTVLLVAALVKAYSAQFGRQPDFWDRFPDMWRGLADHPLLNQPRDVQRQSRFDEWRNSSARGTDSTGNGNFLDTLHGLFSNTQNSGANDDIRSAMVSLGALGNVQPQAGRGQFSFSSLFPEFQSSLASRDWWKGPNVCVERKEENLVANATRNDNPHEEQNYSGHSIHINSCTHSAPPDNDAYTCTTEIQRPNFHRKYLVKYHCCYGYLRDNNGHGCTTTIPMTNLMETLENLKLTQFKKFVQDFGLHTYLEGNNITVFAPTNEAFDDYSLAYNSMSNEIAPSKPQDLRTVIQSHIASGLVRSSDFIDEEIISTLSNSAIRINLFSTPGHVLTADCARVVSLNNLAKNGVVHIVDKVIQPVLMNLEAALRADGRFNTLIQLLADAGLLGQLNDPKGHLTILAPTDDAFRLLERNVRNRLTEDNACLKRVLESHILPNVICSAVIERTAVTTNILNKAIRFDRDVDRLTAQNQTIISADNMATNGMYHVLDAVIIPEEAKNLQQIARDAGLDSFMALVTDTGFGKTLNTMRNVTLFVPSDRAFSRQTPEALTSLSVNVLKYHAVQPAVLLSDFKDNLEMQSTLDGKSLRMNIYETFPLGRNIITVNCVKISVANLRGCDGTIHVLEKVLTVPTGNLLDTLRKGNFSKFLRAVESSGLLNVLTGKGPITVFAPSDAAFELLQPDEKQELLTNATLLKSIVQLHLFPRQICCAGIMEDSMFFGQYSRSLNPSYSLPLHRTRYGQIKIAGSNVQKCDVIAYNGLIHHVDKVIYPKNFL